MHRLQATQYQILDEKKSSIASFKSVNLLLLLFIFTYEEPFIITGLITLSLERRALTQRFFWIHKIRMNRTKLCSQISTLCMGKTVQISVFHFWIWQSRFWKFYLNKLNNLNLKATLKNLESENYFFRTFFNSIESNLPKWHNH